MSETIELTERLNRLRIITKKEVLKLVPYCDQHILRLEKAGKFPRRVDLGANRVGWYLVEVEQWITSRPRRRYLDENAHFPDLT